MEKKPQSVIDELRQIAPDLAEVPRDEPWQVPHNYFRELPDAVMHRIRDEAARPGLVARFQQEVAGWLASLRQPRVALVYASVLALVVAAVFIQPFAGPGDGLLADIPTDEALEYVLNNLDDYAPSEIYALGDPGALNFADLQDLSDQELDEALDVILDDLDTESLEEIF
ncbi:MAG: hypothetical protein R3301_09805 [Saprospiraceae bacterium]|nr:hypothetical protein [Saprospiraceae bacterium]